MLAQLSDIKTRLGIDAADTTQDDDLASILEASADKILSLCRYVDEDTDGIVEMFTDVQQSQTYRTKTRLLAAPSGTPDPAVFKVEGRGHGTTFVQLAVDVLDPADGSWMILGASEWWPPNYVEERRPKFRRWREPVWPVVKVTYNAVGIEGDTDSAATLREATIALAIHWLGQSQAGAVTDVQIGQMKQTISDQPIPQHVKAMLGSHAKRAGATWAR